MLCVCGGVHGRDEAGVCGGGLACVLAVYEGDYKCVDSTTAKGPAPSFSLSENKSKQRWCQQQAPGPAHNTMTLGCHTANP